jgi:hypothetical protein
MAEKMQKSAKMNFHLFAKILIKRMHIILIRVILRKGVDAY